VEVPLTVIHGCVVEAAQVHPSAVATAMLPVPPVAVRVVLAGVNV
jgi:hypothetical protein